MKKLATITTTIAFVLAGLAVYLKKMKLFKKDKS
jgi:hypothetical protein